MQKQRPHFAYMSVFSNFLVSMSCFLRFSEDFGLFFFRLFRVLVHRNPHPEKISFLNFCLNVGKRSHTMAIALHPATFLTMAKSSNYATGLQCNFPEQFLLGSTKNAHDQSGFRKHYLHSSQFTKVNADNEAIHNAFRNGCLWEVMGRVKTNFFDVLDKYGHWKRKCGKSVLGEFSSGVCIP